MPKQELENAMAKAKGEQDIALKIVVEASQDTPTYYVNHAEIAAGQHEIAIWFARLPTKPSRLEMEEAKVTGEIIVDPEFQILVPPTLIPGLISALEQTKERHEAMYGNHPKEGEGK